MEYWAWWQGALALGGLTVAFVFAIGRMMGVSGSWATLLSWRHERQQRAEATAFQANAAAANNALLAATLAEFGEAKTHELFAGQGMAVPGAMPAAAPRRVARSGAWTAHFTFLLFMVVGGLMAALVSGRFDVHLDLGVTHTRLFGSGWQEWLTLIVGGALVGFGTQMGGGCTSGHGLSGVSRLNPPSLIATMSFFGTAVAVSFLLEALHP
jgi:hypothetical protein